MCVRIFGSICVLELNATSYINLLAPLIGFSSAKQKQQAK